MKFITPIGTFEEDAAKIDLPLRLRLHELRTLAREAAYPLEPKERTRVLSSDFCHHEVDYVEALKWKEWDVDQWGHQCLLWKENDPMSLMVERHQTMQDEGPVSLEGQTWGGYKLKVTSLPA